MANPDNVLSTMLQSLFISRDDFDEHSGDKDSNYRQFPFPYYQQADFPIFMLGGGQYIAPGSWSNLTDGEFHHFRFTNDGLLRTDASVSIGNLSVGSTDGVNIDAGLRVSPSTWRPESLIWGVNTTGTEEAGQMERELINAILFRGLTVGGADTNGAPCVFRFDPATKRLLVDISGSTNVSYTQRYYEKVSVTNVNQAVTFIDVGTGLPFTASEITIINDDGTDAVYFNYGAAATVLTEEILAGDGYVDNFASNNVNLIANVVGPLTVRVFARA